MCPKIAETGQFKGKKDKDCPKVCQKNTKAGTMSVSLTITVENKAYYYYY